MPERAIDDVAESIIALSEMDKPTFAIYFREARRKAGWSLDKCSAIFGVDRTSICNWENLAKSTMPRGKNMMKAMAFIVCMLDDFRNEILRLYDSELSES